MKNKTAVIISISSDIGSALGARWLKKEWDVIGTYRRKSAQADNLFNEGAKLVSCDLSDKASVKKAVDEINHLCESWDALVLCPGTLEPVGNFSECNIDQWEDSLQVNFTNQVRLVHQLLSSRNLKSPNGPCVLFFAGGGTNSAPVNYSAYVISKIALIKMTELLDAEIPDTRFAIIGPGWVKTKIHEATIEAGEKAGENYQFTIDKLKGKELTPMEKVCQHVEWVINSPRNVISGRNFSTVSDLWGDEHLEKKLAQDQNMYKLRRRGNDWLVNE